MTEIKLVCSQNHCANTLCLEHFDNRPTNPPLEAHDDLRRILPYRLKDFSVDNNCFQLNPISDDIKGIE